jgi:hypothetical protein
MSEANDESLPPTVESIAARLATIESVLITQEQILNALFLDFRSLQDLVLNDQTYYRRRSHPNPLTRFGKSCFSQADEDGITLEIVRRLEITDGTYAEFGVCDGLENNTLILAALGWRGFWVDIRTPKFDFQQSTKFTMIQEFITLDNVIQLASRGTNFLKTKDLDVVSLDLDGNDFYIVQSLLGSGIKPKLFIVEYNGKFPPPIHFEIPYNPNQIWQGDDYYGASLTSFNELFSDFGYRLICCNAQTGVNAFFIRSDKAHLFPEVPVDIKDIYVEPRYHAQSRTNPKRSQALVEHLFSS